jgi:hypothetical protein
MPATINRLAIQNKTLSVRKSTKIPLSKFNTLDFPKGKFYIEPVITINEPKKVFQTGNLENNYIQ